MPASVSNGTFISNSNQIAPGAITSLIHEEIVSGSAKTSFTQITDVLTKGKVWKIYISTVGTATTAGLMWKVNNNATATNYHRAYHLENNATLSGQYANDNMLTLGTANINNFTELTMYIGQDDKVYCLAYTNEAQAGKNSRTVSKFQTGIGAGFVALDIYEMGANGLGIGSKIQIFEVG